LHLAGVSFCILDNPVQVMLSFPSYPQDRTPYELLGGGAFSACGLHPFMESKTKVTYY